jgi:hypothetical protein
MAEPQSNAPLRKSAESAKAGVVHVRRRLTENFTILSNRLAQRAGSAVTVGVGTYLMSVPDGVTVSIEALRTHFTEGETRLARALNELEAEGFLERVPVRVANGQVRTRTYVYNDPSPAAPSPDRARPAPSHTARPDTAPRPRPQPRPQQERQHEQQPEPQPATASARAPMTEHAPPAASSPAPAAPAPGLPPAPEAVAVLAALRLEDPRLLLSARDVTRLAPAVHGWLRCGIDPHQIVQTISADLPGPILRSPAGLIAYRLEHLKPVPATPLRSPQGRRPNITPMQNCDACDRGHRAEHPGLCRDCTTASAAA